MDGNFSERVQEVIRLSREEALRLGHDYIGTEHILLGLIKEGESVAAAVLQNLGLSLDTIRLEVEKLVQSGRVSLGNIFDGINAHCCYISFFYLLL